MTSTDRNDLAGVTSGMYKVTTESSAYLIDYDTKRAQRTPGGRSTSLRKDGTWFNFIAVVAEVDACMFIWTSDISDVESTYTNRRTTTVVRIESLTE